MRSTYNKFIGRFVFTYGPPHRLGAVIGAMAELTGQYGAAFLFKLKGFGYAKER